MLNVVMLSVVAPIVDIPDDDIDQEECGQWHGNDPAKAESSFIKLF